MASQEPLIRPPLQRRSQESLDRVMRAGLELLKEVGVDGFTLQEVSRRAGVSIGSIYARAASKDALILAIYDRAMVQMVQEEERIKRDASREGLGVRELLQMLVTDMAHVMLDNASLLRVFMRQAPFDSEIWRRGAGHSQAFADTFEQALLLHAAEFSHPDPELAIDIAYRFVYCTLARRITHGPVFESARSVSESDLVRELARAVADYLVGPETATPKRARRRKT
ncbi:MAG: helix-turn-helix domain-containing protein [Solirubrobacteraceae bacterium]